MGLRVASSLQRAPWSQGKAMGKRRMQNLRLVCATFHALALCLIVTMQQKTHIYCCRLPNTPGIYTQAQVSAWAETVKAVKNIGSVFFLQLWHAGRSGHSGTVPCTLHDHLVGIWWTRHQMLDQSLALQLMQQLPICLNSRT